MSNQLTFKTTTLNPVIHNGQTYFTSSDLATMLEYANVDSVTKIYNRNSDEFTSDMTDTVKLTVSKRSTNLQTSTRIFSLRGCHLIAMFARTKVAKECRKWILDLIEKEIANQQQAERKTTVDERTGLRQAVSMLVSKKGLLYSDAYNFVNQRFNVQHIDELSSEQLPQAVEYVHKICLEGELITDPRYMVQENKCDEDTLQLLAKMYHFCNEAQEMRQKAIDTGMYNAINETLGGHFLHNFGMPLKCTMKKARAYFNNEVKKLDQNETVTIDRDTAKAVVQYINKSRLFAQSTEQVHRELFDALGITRFSGIKNDIAATAYDLSHEFNYWLDDFSNQVRPRLPCNF
ncbi:BRO family, N-terminal domain [Phocoenobacter uteri]|uniref:BRO family, N-terminal domain n=1 Tax=Phocoenobacter uteri TaxID=146806 RepID=A0A379CBB0_9PAST|nr:BRO family protein [Phocoenobacter uteri]MDG6880943.1 hypothetical protein [Phocoenobacter uteri]MDG6882788.1 hypothetical protein [Phocoenobacter uteri]SUB58957.1 BRO family, N-terminal domain [Phocoenobacter uteri]